MAAGLTLDSGALIAAEKSSRRVWQLLNAASERGAAVTGPAVVLAQVWRGIRATCSASSKPPTERAAAARTARFAPMPNRPGANGKIGESAGGSSRENRRAVKPLFQASATSAARSSALPSRAARTGPDTQASSGSAANAPASRDAQAGSTSVSSSVKATISVRASARPRLRPTDAPRRASRT